ncbi:hypothetical protein ACRRTK_007285 [Alexandromys fortis]
MPGSRDLILMLDSALTGSRGEVVENQIETSFLQPSAGMILFSLKFHKPLASLLAGGKEIQPSLTMRE